MMRKMIVNLPNDKYIFALDVADFQLKRWLVELFFKWLK